MAYAPYDPIPRQIDVEELRLRIRDVEPAALLVSPRILRRVIKQDRRLPGLGLQVPHHKSYTIGRERLLAIADRAELDLSPAADLPENVILLARPLDDDDLNYRAGDEVLASYGRLLLHARVHREMEQRIAAGQLTPAVVFNRVRQIGFTEFAEIRSVLQRENMLLPPGDDLETYIEFAAVYLELRYFAGASLPVYFPATRDWNRIDDILAQDVPHAGLFASTRLIAPPPPRPAAVERPSPAPAVPIDEGVAARPTPPPPKSYFRGIRRADRVAARGNTVQAAILRWRARQLLNPRSASADRDVRTDISLLAVRLQPVLNLAPAEIEAWADALVPLVPLAAAGFWTSEARLLYDLQKVCLEYERGVYRVDILGWVRSLGRQPFKRRLPLLREVLIAKHLRTAARRLNAVRLSGDQRGKLVELFESAEQTVEWLTRDRVRPVIEAAFSAVGLEAQHVPEQVARAKLIEELLDAIVERGYLTMGTLRDSLSRNQLKLPDLAGVNELVRGDRLLRADKRLAEDLDGIHHRGAAYLRWPQSLSSVAFGTPLGRTITQFAAIPFGGAYLVLKAIDHFVTGHTAESEVTTSGMRRFLFPFGTPTLPIANVYTVGLLGVLLLLLIHRPTFRQWLLSWLVRGWGLARRVIVDWPRRLLSLPVVQSVLQSLYFAVFRNYLLKPALLASGAFAVAFAAGQSWAGQLVAEGDKTRFDFDGRNFAILFLAIDLLLNSPIGRHVDERASDFLARCWHDLRFRIVAAGVRLVVDVFQTLLEGLERVLYTVDELLRFRSGERAVFLAAKAVLGAVWSVVTYVVRIFVTLLIEPQVNPIKHFPVVTVSHKIILPLGIPNGPLSQLLQNFMEQNAANWLAGTTVFLIPGIFGFLVWELKENWRLYAANRSPQLVPVPVGQHNETLVRLLRPGFHSGTLPKLFGRLRKASRKAWRTGKQTGVLAQKHTLRRLEEAVRHFLERELLRLLDEAAQCEPDANPRDGRSLRFAIGQVGLATNRIEAELVPSATVRENPVLVFEERAGWLVAGLRHGDSLADLAADERRVFERALFGLYKLAGVDLVREQLSERLSPYVALFDVTSDGVTVWPAQRHDCHTQYRLRGHHERVLPEETDDTGALLPTFERSDLVFGQQDIRWQDWVAAWSTRESQHPTVTPRSQLLPT